MGARLALREVVPVLSSALRRVVVPVAPPQFSAGLRRKTTRPWPAPYRSDPTPDHVWSVQQADRILNFPLTSPNSKKTDPSASKPKHGELLAILN